jgi:hypothetical protein
MNVTVERAKTDGIVAKSPLAPAAVEQARRNRRGEGLDTGPFSQRPLNAGRPKFSNRIRQVYSIADLAQALGVHHRRVESWADRGLLGKAHDLGRYTGNARFTEANVVLFIREHPREYDLGRVDKIWFTAMVFGDLRILRRRALRRKRNVV